MVRYGIEGRVVVLTGAAGGIGRALASAFAAQGARLVLVDRAGPALAELAQTLGSDGGIACEACDLNEDAAVQTLAARVRSRFGRVDVLLHNAGTEFPTPIADAEPEANARWQALFDNNVVSMVRLTRALLPLLPEGASIIHQSSIWGRSGVADFSAYVASKHAVIGLTRSLALELAPRGIRVNAVCPGWIRTEAALRSLTAMAAAEDISEAEAERRIVARQAVPRMLEPHEIAGVYLFLASDDALPLTGQALVASLGEVMA